MLSDNGKVLVNLISEFSQRYWSAGWLENIEYIVWRTGTYKKSIYLFAEDAQAKHIVELGREFGVWVMWRDADNEIEEVPLEEWERLYEGYMTTYHHSLV